MLSILLDVDNCRLLLPCSLVASLFNPIVCPVPAFWVVDKPTVTGRDRELVANQPKSWQRQSHRRETAAGVKLHEQCTIGNQLLTSPFLSYTALMWRGCQNATVRISWLGCYLVHTKAIVGASNTKCLRIRSGMWAVEALSSSLNVLIPCIEDREKHRVAKCHGYDWYIRVKTFVRWGKKFEGTCNFAKLIFLKTICTACELDSLIW